MIAISWHAYTRTRLFTRACIGSTVFDIGANVGYYTLVASRLVGPSGRVVAFEPVPRNLCYLSDHVRLNRASNVTVHEVAVSDRSGSARFVEGRDPSTGCLDSTGNLLVALVSLDDMVLAAEIPEPDCLKIDVEGAEVEVLRGATWVLRRCRPVIFLALHGLFQRERCIQILTSADYRMRALDGRDTGECDELLAEPVG